MNNTFIDEKTWEALVQRNEPHMLRAAYAILHSKDDAQDAEQDAFIKLLRYQPQYSIKEIAKITPLPAATVGTRLARGRKKLAVLLEGETLL